MKINLLVLTFPILLLAAPETGISLYSGPLLIRPYLANTFEPRVGVTWHLDDNRLRLDIGNSVDLLQYRFASGRRLLTMGGDFFTYTMLAGEKNFHFPVIASDYFFGLNVNYKDTTGHGVLGVRFRISHISAHFVDGHFDGTSGTWKEGLNPRVYSREFFDLSAGYEPEECVRSYAGITYIYHVDPSTLKKIEGYAGVEYHASLSHVLHGFSAYQASFSGLRPRHEIRFGAKVGDWYGRGVILSYVYFTGNSIHGEYYDRREDYSGISCTIDF